MIPRVVHHVIAFLVAPSTCRRFQALDDAAPGPGYTCFGSSGINGNEWLGAWAPGSRGRTSHQAPASALAGSKIALQIHYNSLTAGPQPDTTSIDFKIDDTVEKEGRIEPWANPPVARLQADGHPRRDAGRDAPAGPMTRLAS